MTKKKNEKAEYDMNSEAADNNIENNVEASENEAAQSEELNDEDIIESLKKQVAEQKDKTLRLFADFENFKKRTAKERMQLFSTANQELMTALMPVLDDFGRAMENLKKLNAKTEVIEGVELIHTKFEKILQSKGLKVMESTKGLVFDSETMDAITQIPAPTPDLGGKVIEEVERGYKLGDKIIRHPKVVVAQKA